MEDRKTIQNRKLIFNQKKFYTSTRIRVSQLAKIPTLFLIVGGGF